MLVGFGTEFKNGSANRSVFKLSYGRRTVQPFVICASVYTENSAQSDDWMLIWKSFYRNQSLPECGVNIAFFNMRFSSSSCALRFCNSLICCPLFWYASTPKCAHEARRRGAVPNSQALILSNNPTLKAKLAALKKYEIFLLQILIIPKNPWNTSTFAGFEIDFTTNLLLLTDCALICRNILRAEHPKQPLPKGGTSAQYNFIQHRKAALPYPNRETRNAAFFMPSCHAVGAKRALKYKALRVRFSQGKGFIPKPSKLLFYCVTNKQQRSWWS